MELESNHSSSLYNNEGDDTTTAVAAAIGETKTVVTKKKKKKKTKKEQEVVVATTTTTVNMRTLDDDKNNMELSDGTATTTTTSPTPQGVDGSSNPLHPTVLANSEEEEEQEEDVVIHKKKKDKKKKNTKRKDNKNNSNNIQLGPNSKEHLSERQSLDYDDDDTTRDYEEEKTAYNKMQILKSTSLDESNEDKEKKLYHQSEQDQPTQEESTKTQGYNIALTGSQNHTMFSIDGDNGSHKSSDSTTSSIEESCFHDEEQPETEMTKQQQEEIKPRRVPYPIIVPSALILDNGDESTKRSWRLPWAKSKVGLGIIIIFMIVLVATIVLTRKSNNDSNSSSNNARYTFETYDEVSIFVVQWGLVFNQCDTVNNQTIEFTCFRSHGELFANEAEATNAYIEVIDQRGKNLYQQGQKNISCQNVIGTNNTMIQCTADMTNNGGDDDNNNNINNKTMDVALMIACAGSSNNEHSQAPIVQLRTKVLTTTAVNCGMNNSSEHVTSTLSMASIGFNGTERVGTNDINELQLFQSHTSDCIDTPQEGMAFEAIPSEKNIVTCWESAATWCNLIDTNNGLCNTTIPEFSMKNTINDYRGVLSKGDGGGGTLVLKVLL